MESNETSHDQHPLRQSLSLRNIRQMTLTGCSKLCCLPIATDVMLEELKIQGCHKLKHIISNEPEDHDDVNGSSIFPELKMLEIKDCDDLKFLFPPTFSTGLQRLTSIDIDGAPKLENIFGGYHHEKNEVPIKLLALEKLSLRDVPQIVSMCAKNYHLEWPSLKHINLERELVKRAFPHSMVCLQGRQLKLETGDQDSIRRPCPDLMDCLRGRQPNCETGEDTMKLLMGMQHLTNLEIRDSEIEEIFNVEGIEIAGKVEIKLKVMKIEGLHKLSCLYKDPNNILNLSNLEDLVLSGCDQLTAIFTTSKMKHLPQLYRLEVTQCKELVYVIEDNGDSGQQSLPKLQTIRISNCEKLESLLSISTFSKLQKLESLEIEEASNLKEVFGCRQDDTRERRLKDVVPELLHLKLKNLPNLENFCRVIDCQSVKRIMKFEVFHCARWERLQGIEEPQSTYSNTGQAVPHISDVGTSSQGHSRSDIQKHMNTEEVTGEVPFSETSAMVPSSSDSASTGGLSTEETMENQANSPTPAVEEQASETSPAELEMTRTSLHSNGAIQNKRVQEDLTSKDDEEATPLADRAPRNSLATSVTPQQIVIERISEDTAIMKGKAIPSSINSQAGNPQSSQPTLEARKKIVGNNRRKQKMEIQWPTSALPSLAENNEEVTQKTGEEVPISRKSAKSNDAIRNERVREGLTSKDDGEPTPLADIALRNSVTPRQDLIKIEPRNETIMTLQQEMGEMRNTVTESSMKRKVDHSSVYSEVGGSQSSQSMLTTKKTRHSSVQEGATETNLPHVVPSYYQESHIGVAGPSSQRLGIGEILEVMELKDGEPALLVKALELYPQLRLSRDEQRNRKIIALSYRVLCDILFMLTTKTPCTIATSEKLTLSENLDAAISLGFDKEWIDSVRAKVFGNAMFDVLAAEEETLVNKTRLETYSTALEQVDDQRIEAIERIAMARRHLDLMRSELEAMDSQLFSELEERNKLIMNMMQFREIISANDRPFGI